MAARLRPVASGERATPRPRGKTVSAAANSGTQRELLVAMRTVVAKALDNPKTLPRDLGTLSRRMQEIVRDIEAIDAREREESSGGHVADEPFDAAAL